MVISLRNALRAEGIGLDNVGTRRKVLLVYFLDNMRLRQHQQFVVAFDVVGEIRETCAAIRFFIQLVALDHGAHRAIEHENALTECGFNRGKT